MNPLPMELKFSISLSDSNGWHLWEAALEDEGWSSLLVPSQAPLDPQPRAPGHGQDTRALASPGSWLALHMDGCS